MSDPDWKTALQAAAPAVATALGGPLAGLAATVLGRVLLGRNEETPTTVAEAQEAIAQATSTPEGIARLREAEAKLVEMENNLQIRMEEIGAGDRADARVLARHDLLTPRFLAIAVVGSFVAMTAAILLGYVANMQDSTTATLIGAVVGYLSAKADTIVAFYFGSSIGSRDKTDALAAAAGVRRSR